MTEPVSPDSDTQPADGCGAGARVPEPVSPHSDTPPAADGGYGDMPPTTGGCGGHASAPHVSAQHTFLHAFQKAGARVVEPDILQPARALLDLYGEDIRARAFTTHDPLCGEMMLRPDFTVPVAQMHMRDHAEPARYTYAGPVFRRQQDGGRPREYTQVGFELFTRTDDPAKAEAEVFALFHRLLADYPVMATTGDMGVVIAAVDGLATTDHRRAALRRHIWRPRRFRALMNRFAGCQPLPHARQALVDDPRTPEDLATLAPRIGLRTAREVADRIARIRTDAAAPPISRTEATIIDTILDLKDTAPSALKTLRTLARDMACLTPALDALDARLSAFTANGIDVDALHFDAAYGCTRMEYYDGFVFGFSAPERPDLPPVASGGRYDALTAALGNGVPLPAVGGALRMDVLHALPARDVCQGPKGRA